MSRAVEDTIAILRGLKERYEVHHGVRIQDAALVAAAVLSHRYISDRFLPDKAVDLVDEAASRLKIELDSMPTEIDVIEREIMQLEMERQALKKEKDRGEQGAPDEIGEGARRAEGKVRRLKAEWQKEKAVHRRAAKAERAARRSRGPSWNGPSAAANWPRRASCNMAASPSWNESCAEIDRER